MKKEQIIRLTKYKRTLYQLKSLGLDRVFSNNLGDPIGVSSTLVRKDFSLLQIPGNKRGGYEIDALTERLDQILGKNSEQFAVLIGCGKIGTALLEYDGFRKEGTQIVAGFDKYPQKVTTRSTIPVYNCDDLSAFIRQHRIQVAILCTPDSEAIPLYTKLREAGIRGILNFTQVELKKIPVGCDECADSCIINNINIGLELEQIFSQLNLEQQNRL